MYSREICIYTYCTCFEIYRQCIDRVYEISINLGNKRTFLSRSSDTSVFYKVLPSFTPQQARLFIMQVPHIFELNEHTLINNATVQNPLKTRSCFIRLLRDKEVEERIRKKYKKNDTEVNERINMFYTYFN